MIEIQTIQQEILQKWKRREFLLQSLRVHPLAYKIRRRWASFFRDVVVVATCFLGFVSGCSHLSNRTIRTVDAETIAIAAKTLTDQCKKSPLSEVRGRGTIRIESPEKNMRARTSIDVIRNQSVDIEFNNPLGGTEGRLSVKPVSSSNGDAKEITYTKSDGITEKEVAANLWNGLPIAWVESLFLGEIPCESERINATALTQISSTERKDLNDIQSKLGDFQFMLMSSSKDTERPIFHFIFSIESHQTETTTPIIRLSEMVRQSRIGETMHIIFGWDPNFETGLKSFSARSSKGAVQFTWFDAETKKTVSRSE